MPMLRSHFEVLRTEFDELGRELDAVLLERKCLDAASEANKAKLGVLQQRMRVLRERLEAGQS